MSSEPQLLAKSLRQQLPPLTLEAHCRDTEEAAVRVFRLGSRWGPAWGRLLPPQPFDACSVLAELADRSLVSRHREGQRRLPSVGRARGGRDRQTLRHEHISALILSLPNVRTWLEGNPELDVDVITAAVLSHHFKATDEPTAFYRWCAPHTERVRLQLNSGAPRDHRDLRARARTGRPRRGSEAANFALVERGSLARGSSSGRKNARRLRRAVGKDRDPVRHSLLLAVKAGVVVADTVASGLYRAGGCMGGSGSRRSSTHTPCREMTSQTRSSHLAPNKSLARGESPSSSTVFKNWQPSRAAARCSLPAAGQGRRWRRGSGQRTPSSPSADRSSHLLVSHARNSDRGIRGLCGLGTGRRSVTTARNG